MAFGTSAVKIKRWGRRISRTFDAFERCGAPAMPLGTDCMSNGIFVLAEVSSETFTLISTPLWS